MYEMASYTGDIPENDTPEGKMPLGYRILFGVISIGILGLTVWVWIMAVLTIVQENMGVWVPDDFRRLFMGYHIIMLLIALVGWGMQTHWRRSGTLELFPTAIVIGALSLIAATIQLFALFRAIG